MGFRLILIRHGETMHNKHSIIQGQLDIPLSPKGMQQAVLLSQRFKNTSFQAVWSSDLSRAWQTANLLISASRNATLTQELTVQPSPTLSLDKRLRERHFGVAQGCSAVELRKTAAIEGRNIMSFTPEGAETSDELQQRVVEFFQELCSNPKYMENQDPVAVVTHGGWLRELTTHISAKYNVNSSDGMRRVSPNTGVSELFIELDKNYQISNVRVISLHDKSHLDGMEICDEFSL